MTSSASFTFINITITDEDERSEISSNSNGKPAAAGDNFKDKGTTGGFSPITGLSTTSFSGLIDVSNANFTVTANSPRGFSDVQQLVVAFNFTGQFPRTSFAAGNFSGVIDFFSFGQSGDGNLPSERFNNAIYRLQLEEAGKNSGIFIGNVEYRMLNQVNVNDSALLPNIPVFAPDSINVIGKLL